MSIYLIKWHIKEKGVTYTKEVAAKNYQLALKKAGKKISSRILAVYVKIN